MKKAIYLFIRTLVILLMVSGTAYAQVTSEDIENNTIRSSDIKNNAIQSIDIKNATIEGIDIKNATIESVDIKDGTVTSADIAQQTINTGDIKNEAVTAKKVSPELSNAIGTYCAIGEVVVGMAADGNFVCEPTGVDSLEAQVAALLAYLEVDTSDPSKPVVRIVGANFQVVNGLGDTETKNGVGNLIVGYDEAAEPSSAEFCSVGLFEDESSCLSAGETWGHNQKSGSHYIVGGSGNSYTQSGGLVVGYWNVSNAAFSSVSGGTINTASGFTSSVSGGYDNTASGDYASVSGGTINTASGSDASVSGGYDNTASGFTSSVSGGYDNTASGDYASVSGGAGHVAWGDWDWVAGSLWQDQ